MTQQNNSQQRANGLAVASLVCGICFCVPFASIAAIVLGIIGLQQTKDGRAQGRGMAMWGLVLGCVGILLNVLVGVFLGIAFFAGARVTAQHVQCAAEMRQISVALIRYSQSNGVYPMTLNDLVNAGSISSSVLRCPSGGGAYVYHVAGADPRSVTAQTVVLDEPTKNHRTGSNVLYGDGGVMYEKGWTGAPAPTGPNSQPK